MLCNSSVCKGLQWWSITNCNNVTTRGKFVCGQNSYAVTVRSIILKKEKKKEKIKIKLFFQIFIFARLI